MTRMREIRQQSGLKIRDIVEHLGITRVTLWNYETGKRKPTFDMMVKLAAIYGVSVSAFVVQDSES